MEKQIPKLKKEKGNVQLIVDGKPFVILGGELHNSSGSVLKINILKIQ